LKCEGFDTSLALGCVFGDFRLLHAILEKIKCGEAPANCSLFANLAAYGVGKLVSLFFYCNDRKICDNLRMHTTGALTKLIAGYAELKLAPLLPALCGEKIFVIPMLRWLINGEHLLNFRSTLRKSIYFKHLFSERNVASDEQILRNKERIMVEILHIPCIYFAICFAKLDKRNELKELRADLNSFALFCIVLNFEF